MRKKIFFIFLFLACLLAGFFWAFSFGNNPGFSDDARAYDETAQKILKSEIAQDIWIKNQMHDRPFYAIFLAGIYAIFGHSFVTVKIIQIFFYALIGILIYLVSSFLITEKKARMAGILWIFAFSPAAYAGVLYREIFFSFLLVSTIFFLYRSQIKNPLPNLALSGFFFGFAFLTNSVLQFFVFLILINIFIVFKKENVIFKIKSCLVFLLPFVLIVGLWYGYCQINFKTMPTGGAGLFLAERVETMHNVNENYLPHLIGNSLGDFISFKLFAEYNPKLSRHGWHSWQEYDRLVAQGVDFKTINKIFTKPSLKEIMDHPIMFLKMEIIDFLKFNQPMTPIVWMQAMFVGTHMAITGWLKILIILAIRFWHLFLSMIIIYAIIKSIKNWSKVSWIFLVIFYFNFVYSSLHANARYSIPIYPFYIIFLCLGCWFLINKFTHKNENLLNC